MVAAAKAREITNLFADDPAALQVLECFYQELSRRQMRERTLMSEKQLAATIRRIRRKAGKLRSGPSCSAIRRHRAAGWPQELHANRRTAMQALQKRLAAGRAPRWLLTRWSWSVTAYPNVAEPRQRAEVGDRPRSPGRWERRRPAGIGRLIRPNATGGVSCFKP